MLFLVTGHDHPAPEGPARRAATRERHLARAEALRAAGQLRYAAALLDDAGAAMVGSMMFVDFPTREALDAWLATEPYVVEQVWARVEVRPVRVAPMFAPQ